jgi:hypothetical protein
MNRKTHGEITTMNRHTRTLALTSIALVGALAGCLGAPVDDHGSDQTVGAATGFTLDTTGISAAPAATLPSARLPLAAFTEANIARDLIVTNEPLTPISTLGSRVNAESASWHLERDSAKGLIFAFHTPLMGAEVAQSDAQLQSASAARLARWGVPSAEIVRTLQRRLMSRDEDNSVIADAPRLIDHKTFFFRGINGVPIEGHRAVVTWGRDGTLRRVLLRWPALAASGHRLRTTLSVSQIRSRALTALRNAGETSGAARLRWKYVATAQTDGSVALTLMVGARLAGSTNTNGTTEEPREIDVDVSAR